MYLLISRYGSGSYGGQDSNSNGGYQPKSFHESMMTASKSRARSRSRSPTRNTGWSDSRGRERSRSPERFSGAAPAKRSFHESMMNGGQRGPNFTRAEDEEEGMIRQ